MEYKFGEISRRNQRAKAMKNGKDESPFSSHKNVLGVVSVDVTLVSGMPDNSDDNSAAAVGGGGVKDVDQQEVIRRSQTSKHQLPKSQRDKFVRILERAQIHEAKEEAVRAAGFLDYLLESSSSSASSSTTGDSTGAVTVVASNIPDVRPKQRYVQPPPRPRQHPKCLLHRRNLEKAPTVDVDDDAAAGGGGVKDTKDDKEAIRDSVTEAIRRSQLEKFHRYLETIQEQKARQEAWKLFLAIHQYAPHVENVDAGDDDAAAGVGSCGGGTATAATSAAVGGGSLHERSRRYLHATTTNNHKISNNNRNHHYVPPPPAQGLVFQGQGLDVPISLTMSLQEAIALLATRR